MYTYADLIFVYLIFVCTCVVVSVIIVACSLFLSICLFVLVNCLLNAFAIMCGCGDCFICESYCIVVVKCGALWLVCLCY